MSDHCDKKFIEDFDDETILTAAMDVLDNAVTAKDNVPELERKIGELRTANEDVNSRMRSLVASNKQITRLLREAIPEDVVGDGVAGNADLVHVLLAWALGSVTRLEAKEKALDDALSEIKRFREWHDDFVEQLGEGIHVMFRKYMDNEESGEIWELISRMPPNEWFDGVGSLAAAFYYGHDRQNMHELLEMETEGDTCSKS